MGEVFQQPAKRLVSLAPKLAPARKGAGLKLKTKILDVFNEIFRPMLERILENHEKAQTLASLRDTLLPRLITGQLRLDEVQAQSADFAS